MKNIVLIVGIFLGLSACVQSDKNVIAYIPEASGISYCKNTDILIVVNDEGTYYEISTEGKILKKVKLGNYDLEAVVCEDKEILFLREDKGLFTLDRKTGKETKIPLDTFYKGTKPKLFDKKEGIEGLAKVDNLLYLAKQSKKKKKSFIVVVKMKPYPSKIVDVIKHKIADTSGLSYHEGSLYMLSDKEDLLVKYDLNKNKIVQKVALNKGAWEGIAFDNKGYVYLADDDGRVLKYTKKSLGL